MTRLFDWLVEAWDRLRSLFGLNRLTRKGRGNEMSGHSLIWRVFYFVRPVIALFLIWHIPASLLLLGHPMYAKPASPDLPRHIAPTELRVLVPGND